MFICKEPTHGVGSLSYRRGIRKVYSDILVYKEIQGLTGGYGYNIIEYFSQSSRDGGGFSGTDFSP